MLRRRGVLCIRTMCGDPPAALRDRFDPVTRIVRRGDVAERYMGRPDEILREIAQGGSRVDRWGVLGAEGEQEVIAVATPVS